MEKRNEEKYKMKNMKTKRLQDFALPYMRILKNKESIEKKKIYIDFLQSSMDSYQVKSDNCQGWSKTTPRMVTHQPKDGHPPERSVLKTGNLALRLKTQN